MRHKQSSVLSYTWRFPPKVINYNIIEKLALTVMLELSHNGIALLGKDSAGRCVVDSNLIARIAAGACKCCAAAHLRRNNDGVAGRIYVGNNVYRTAAVP